ncbi:MAG: alpha/beta hydrolase [Woeseiaceae bacterium]
MSSTLWLLLVAAIVAWAVVYLRYPEALFRGFVALARQSSRVSAKSVNVDGIAWPYLEGGDRKRDVLVFVHGYSGDKDNWTLYARRFTRKYRVIIPDLPGFGDNTLDPQLDYSISAQAQRLLRFLDAVGIDSCHMAGNSMGGYITLMIALDQPQRVTSIALLDNAGVKSPQQSALEEQLEHGVNPFTVDSLQDVDRLMAFTFNKPMYLPGAFKKVILRLSLDRKEHLDRVLEQIIKEIESTTVNARLTEISVPVLVIWGRHDQVIDVSCVAVLDAAVPNVHSVILEHVGHIPMLEDPGSTARHHLEFLDAKA